MNRILTFLLLSQLVVLTACENETSSVTTPAPGTVAADDTQTDLNSYTTAAITDSEAVMAYLYSTEGKLMESGPLRDGKRNGTWAYYGTDSDFPIKVISYVDDARNGLYTEYNDRGQAELMANYKNNLLHGPWGKFRFGRSEATANYNEGQLDGVMREYDFRNGNLKKETSYKMGVLDGLLRNYNDEGKVIVEYMYRDGEQVSGGMVEGNE